MTAVPGRPKRHSNRQPRLMISLRFLFGIAHESPLVEATRPRRSTGLKRNPSIRERRKCWLRGAREGPNPTNPEGGLHTMHRAYNCGEVSVRRLTARPFGDVLRGTRFCSIGQVEGDRLSHAREAPSGTGRG